MIHDNGECIVGKPTDQDCGYRALWIAVVFRGWLDIVQPKTIGPGLDHQLDGARRSQLDAISWALETSKAVGSLAWICHAADLPDAIIEEMQGLARQAQAAHKITYR